MTKIEKQRLLALLDKTYNRRTPLDATRLAARILLLRLRLMFIAFGKRALDIAGSSVLLILLSPVFLLVGIIVRLDGGPAFYSQYRIGRHGSRFRFWKFRSMVPNADKLRTELEQQNEMQGGVIFKMNHDPRITPVGRILRRTSIDELPQLWNVLLGDMSLVGPRPPLPDEVNQYTSRERLRLEGKQGITCTWQVSGRSEIPFQEQVAMDIDYIENQSLWKDIKLLFRTLPAVISGRGAA
ncbi:MAG: sugar transferase [Acidobacteriota bacterium]|nr:sugar transferase [Acidobacteriota bacterium]